MRLVAAVCVVLALAFPSFASTFSYGGPSSTNNDDTCDIGLYPAATLLLPYFEVDLDAPQGSGRNTIFTIANLANREQVVLVTLWTDRAYPVLWFNVYLTGYDMQSISLYDVIALGDIAPPRGTGTGISHEGEFSTVNDRLDTTQCGSLPGSIPAVYRERMRDALMRGRVDAFAGLPACSGIGGVNRWAVGYATIDVVGECNIVSPEDPAYYDGIIGYDNVLTGDYMLVDGDESMADGSPLVHIRAIPEGEDAATRAAFPREFAVNFPHVLPALQRAAKARCASAAAVEIRRPLHRRRPGLV